MSENEPRKKYEAPTVRTVTSTAEKNSILQKVKDGLIADIRGYFERDRKGGHQK